MLDRRWRHGVERGLGPLGRGLRRLGIPADALTVFGLLASVATAVLIASGHLAWAVVGVIVAGVSDLLDGAIARGSGQASPRGAFFDSVTDRVSDALLLGGIAWYLVGGAHPYETVLAFAVAACSMLVSYERAKAESLGLNARGGLMERAERFVLLAVALAFNIIVPVLWIMLVATAGTAVYRFALVYRQAAHPPRVHTRRERRIGPRDETRADPRRPAPLRTWFTARRVEGDRTRRRHPSVRRNSRP
jgi:CDP-diacylglycerol---glycerol-3-phosphate 3-phosphatidyltransferase